MDIYTINGVEFEYDTYEMDNLERLEEALDRFQETLSKIKGKPDENGETKFTMKMVRQQGNAMLDFFDDVFGEGSAEKIFGRRMNIVEIADSFQGFTGAITEKNTRLSERFRSLGSEPNREQRRASEHSHEHNRGRNRNRR